MQGLIINRAAWETMVRLLDNAVSAWPEFDSDEPIDAGDLIEWFGDFRDETKAILRDVGHGKV